MFETFASFHFLQQTIQLEHHQHECTKSANKLSAITCTVQKPVFNAFEIHEIHTDM